MKPLIVDPTRCSSQRTLSCMVPKYLFNGLFYALNLREEIRTEQYLSYCIYAIMVYKCTSSMDRFHCTIFIRWRTCEIEWMVGVTISKQQSTMSKMKSQMLLQLVDTGGLPQRYTRLENCTATHSVLLQKHSCQFVLETLSMVIVFQ